MKRRTWLLGILVLLVFNANSAYLQQIGQQNTIYYRVAAEAYGFDPSAFIAQIETGFAHYDIKALELPDELIFKVPQVWLGISHPIISVEPSSVVVDSEHIQISLTVYPVSKSLLKLSPVVYSHHSHFFLLQLSDEARLQDKDTIDYVSDSAIGLGLYALNHCEDAKQYFKKMIGSLSSFQSNAQVRIYNENIVNFYRANCAISRADFGEAISKFESIILKGRLPFEFVPAVNLAWTYLHVGRQSEAFTLMNQLITAIPTDEYANTNYLDWAYAKRAQLHALNFEYDDAIKDMDEAIRIASSYNKIYLSEFYMLRGQIYLMLYEWDKVLADYNKAIELSPQYADYAGFYDSDYSTDAYFYRGVLFYTRGDPDSARPDFEKYLELAPDGAHAPEAQKYADQIRTTQDALNK